MYKVEIQIEAELFHKQTFNKLIVEEKIVRAFNDGDETYNEIMEQMGVSSEGTDFETMSKFLNETMTRNLKERVDKIAGAVRDCYYMGTTAYIEFGGYIINPADFCAVKFGKIYFNFRKVN